MVIKFQQKNFWRNVRVRFIIIGVSKFYELSRRNFDTIKKVILREICSILCSSHTHIATLIYINFCSHFEAFSRLYKLGSFFDQQKHLYIQNVIGVFSSMIIVRNQKCDSPNCFMCNEIKLKVVLVQRNVNRW